MRQLSPDSREKRLEGGIIEVLPLANLGWKTIYMSKRIKSFFITLSSLVGTALLTVVATPQWADFVTWANAKAAGYGIPLVVVALVGVVISEIWKAILNKHTLMKADERIGGRAVVNASLY
jgi:hypothetical protein